MSDWCQECDTPIGHGRCAGCNAAGCACDEQDDGCCHHCGKHYEDFSDLGCGYCDQRHPGFGACQ